MNKTIELPKRFWKIDVFTRLHKVMHTLRIIQVEEDVRDGANYEKD